MSRPLKIAIYSGEVPSATFIERLILGLSKTDCTIYLFGVRYRPVSYSPDVKVVTYTHNRFKKFLHLVTYTILLSLFKHKDKKKLDVILKSQSKNLIYSKVKSYPVLWHQPDIFHVQWAKSLSEWMWVQDFGMQLVLSLRGAHINYSPIADEKLANMYRIHFPKVNGFHAVSKAISEAGQAYGAPKDKIKVVYSGLDLALFNSTIALKLEQGFRILSVGRTHWKKGYTYALDACKLLKDAGIPFHYTIVGALGSIELEYQLEDLGLQDAVTLTDNLPFDEVKEHLDQADVLLLPSVEEGIANVVLEAMALGTLVLSTACGGMNEVIIDGVNGYLVPVRDPKAITGRLQAISNMSKSDRELLIINAKATLANQHQASQMVAGMVSLYESVMTQQDL